MSIAGLVAIAFTGLTVALFRGCFDQGTFEVKSVVWSSAGRAAIVAERSDHEALNSDEYFVFVDDHAPSVDEVRSALYSSRPVFSSSSPCVTTRWKDASHLVVFCRDGEIDKSHINVHKDRAGDVMVEFEGIRMQ